MEIIHLLSAIFSSVGYIILVIAKNKLPNFYYENLYWQKGFTVIGIDEVGRGAFAGPVGVGGVMFDSKPDKKQTDYLLSLGISDSKKLTAKKREYLSEVIKQLAKAYHITYIDVDTINNVGIGKATFQGMSEVANILSKSASNPFLLIDAFEIPQMKISQKGIVRGDSLSISIAAASIIAKVERDKLMCELAKEYPQYGFEKHKGYGTLAHRSSISLLGMTKHHRSDFCKNTKTSQV